MGTECVSGGEDPGAELPVLQLTCQLQVSSGVDFSCPAHLKGRRLWDQEPRPPADIITGHPDRCPLSLPRPLSVSELLSQQHLACVSNLSWSTNQHRAWAREVGLSLPGQRALPRVNLLLIGWLREGRGGEWRLEDDGGSVRCEVRRGWGFCSSSKVRASHSPYMVVRGSGSIRLQS